MRFGFNCKLLGGAGLSFNEGKLFQMWFCTNTDLKEIMTRNFEPGVRHSYYTDDNKREWWDATTYSC